MWIHRWLLLAMLFTSSCSFISKQSKVSKKLDITKEDWQFLKTQNQNTNQYDGAL
ncbi:exported protein of unknown function [Legionella fallonii LLAP-10]|uniref:Uncharacterized protein n=1 Tax=Legionella fallonii LLAP-10 TaxID=1212491 RepID=A0A098G2L6_9GAMM|nr:exported protein of unknown function [Legionella fallonii LLAP-10]